MRNCFVQLGKYDEMIPQFTYKLRLCIVKELLRVIVSVRVFMVDVRVYSFVSLSTMILMSNGF